MIYVTGDTHGDFKKLIANERSLGREDHLIVCGDFGGLWDGSDVESEKLDRLSELPYNILFVDGNHENFDLLNALPVAKRYGGSVHELRKNVLHLMRGQIFEIEDKRLFAMGGGACHDVWGGIYEPDDPDLPQIEARMKAEGLPYRIDHVSWWREELPSTEEYDEAERNLTACGFRVDYVVTHCAPTSIQDVFSPFCFERDRLTEYFEKLSKKCDFKRWYFGHYHADEVYDGKFVAVFNDVIPIEEDKW